jgi:hypothetical protein
MTTNELTAKQQKEVGLSERMIRLYCHDRHATKDDLCAECANLLEYVKARVARCPYGEDKPTCRCCPIHCYRPAERERIKEVMRHSGPRLLLRGDIGAVMHMLHDRKPVPELKKK